MTTNAYAAKRAIIARLTAEADSGNFSGLKGVQVAYKWPGDVADVCVYGGLVTFDQPGVDDAVDGERRLVQETANIWLHIRVRISPPPPGRPEEADERAEAIGEAIAAVFTADRNLAGGSSVTRIASGQGDYGDDDDADTSVLTYQVETVSWIEQ